MNLLSLSFGMFFLGTLALYNIVPLKRRWWVLLIGSMAFYLLSATAYTVLYLVFSIMIVYFGARYIAKETSQHKKAVYVTVLGSNVALLVLLKYVNGFWETGSRLLSLVGVTLPPFAIEWLAPLGMSFYTLQLIGYLTDVYWGICSPQQNPAKLALFASYFPSISSGPILRYHQMEHELFDGHKANYENITFGMQRILWGLIKKLVIAERMAAIARPIFADINMYNGVWLWMGLLAAVLQIYADFSGNMDFIIGVSECFGVRLPENFRQPFFSLTIQEFWQRWHITLGEWLKDYIMYPLLRSKLWAKLGKFTKRRFGKKAAKLLPTLLAMFVLWLVNGIWHAGYPKYIMTVMWFWFAVTVGQLFEPSGKKLVKLLKINTGCFSWRLFQRMRTIAIYSIGVLFFSAQSVMTALKMGKSALFPQNIFELFSPAIISSDKASALWGGQIGLCVLLFSLTLLLGVEAFHNRGGNVRKWLAEQNILFRWIVLAGLILFFLWFGIFGPDYDATEFIYANF